MTSFDLRPSDELAFCTYSMGSDAWKLVIPLRARQRVAICFIFRTFPSFVPSSSIKSDIS